MKKCQFCEADISDTAKKCKHCGEWVTENTSYAQADTGSSSAAYSPSGQQHTRTSPGQQFDETTRAVHANKSYIGHAILTLIMYYVGFYIVGLICNLIFISHAKKSKEISGISPSGIGFLWFLLWFHLIIPIGFIVLVVLSLLGFTVWSGSGSAAPFIYTPF